MDPPRIVVEPLIARQASSEKCRQPLPSNPRMILARLEAHLPLCVPHIPPEWQRPLDPALFSYRTLQFRADRDGGQPLVRPVLVLGDSLRQLPEDCAVGTRLADLALGEEEEPVAVPMPLQFGRAWGPLEAVETQVPMTHVLREILLAVVMEVPCGSAFFPRYFHVGIEAALQFQTLPNLQALLIRRFGCPRYAVHDLLFEQDVRDIVDKGRDLAAFALLQQGLEGRRVGEEHASGTHTRKDLGSQLFRIARRVQDDFAS